MANEKNDMEQNATKENETKENVNIFVKDNSINVRQNKKGNYFVSVVVPMKMDDNSIKWGSVGVSGPKDLSDELKDAINNVNDKQIKAKVNFFDAATKGVSADVINEMFKKDTVDEQVAFLKNSVGKNSSINNLDVTKLKESIEAKASRNKATEIYKDFIANGNLGPRVTNNGKNKDGNSKNVWLLSKDVNYNVTLWDGNSHNIGNNRQSMTAGEIKERYNAAREIYRESKNVGKAVESTKESAKTEKKEPISIKEKDSVNVKISPNAINLRENKEKGKYFLSIGIPMKMDDNSLKTGYITVSGPKEVPDNVKQAMNNLKDEKSKAVYRDFIAKGNLGGRVSDTKGNEKDIWLLKKDSNYQVSLWDNNVHKTAGKVTMTASEIKDRYDATKEMVNSGKNITVSKSNDQSTNKNSSPDF